MQFILKQFLMPGRTGLSSYLHFIWELVEAWLNSKANSTQSQNCSLSKRVHKQSSGNKNCNGKLLSEFSEQQFVSYKWHTLIPFTQIIQMLSQSKNIVVIFPGTGINPATLHSTTEAADGCTILQTLCLIHDAFNTSDQNRFSWKYNS